MNDYSAAVIGMDLGDRKSHICALNSSKKVSFRTRIPTTKNGIEDFFAGRDATTVVIEVGTHSMWVGEMLTEIGHEVIVANARKVKLLSESNTKNDDNDAELLARLGLADPKLLYPIIHRGLEDHADVAVLQTRHALVEARTKLINRTRGLVKCFGDRLRKCSTGSFHKLETEVPDCLRAPTAPLFASIAQLSVQTKMLDKELERLCDEKYPETKKLRAIRGVGPVTALLFILTIDDSSRFEQSRDVGPYVGLVPKQHDSGNRKSKLRITKAGSVFLRAQLLQCAHYIIGVHGEDCDLRDFGLRIFNRGGDYAKARAAVAVARKLAVLMHRLLVTGDDYDKFHNRKRNTTINRRSNVIQDPRLRVTASFALNLAQQDGASTEFVSEMAAPTLNRRPNMHRTRMFKEECE